MTKYSDPVTDPQILAQFNSGSDNASADNALNIKYSAPVTDPEILKQFGNDQKNNESFLDKALRYGIKDPAAGALNLGQNSMNSIYGVEHSLMPNIVNQQNTPAFARPSNINFAQMMGIKNPNLADKLIQGAVQYAPFGAFGAQAATGMGAMGASKTIGEGLAKLLARIGTQSGAGSLYGATQDYKDHLGGMAQGALYGALGEIGGSALGKSGSAYMNHLTEKLFNPIKEAAISSAKSAAPYLGAVQSMIKDAAQSTGGQYAAKAMDTYRKFSDFASQKWEKALGRADQHDAALKNTAGEYTQDTAIPALEKLQKEYTRKSGNALTDHAEQALKIIGNIKDNPSGNFRDAVERIKDINELYNMPSEGVDMSKGFVDQLHGVLKQNLYDNLKKQGIHSQTEGDLGDLLDSARQATTDKYKIFHEIPTLGGKAKSKIVGSEGAGTSPDQSAGFVEDYMPQKTSGRSGEMEEGIDRFHQLANVLGDVDEKGNLIPDHNSARNALRNHMFGKNPDPKAMMNEYGKLSDLQKNYIWNGKKPTDLEATQMMLQKNPKALDEPKAQQNWLGRYGGKALFTVLGSLVSPTLAAAYGLYNLGKPIAGAAASMVNSTIAHTPGIKQYLMRRAAGENTPLVNLLRQNIIPGSAVTQGSKNQPISFEEEQPK